MMNYIWGGMIIFSFVSAIFTGNMQSLSDTVMNSALDAVNLIIRLTGMMCLWGGIMRIAEKSGLTVYISRCLGILFSRLYKNVDKNSKTAEAMSMNITANLLGLGNAATPLGLEAMRRMQEENGDKTKATDDMIIFVVMNSSAMRLIPTTVATLRTQAGSVAPMEIMPATWVSTALSLMSGILVAKTLSAILSKKPDRVIKIKRGAKV